MTTLDMTARADEFREIARDWCDDIGNTPLHDYAYRGEITVGLSAEVRRWMAINESYANRLIDFATRAANAVRLGSLLGHVAPLEDALKVGDL